MAKKFIEWLEAASLIILTAACVIGVTKHLDSHTDEPKEDTPIVEELPNEEEPGEETPEVVELNEFKLILDDETHTFKFENGMTWEQWVDSEFNTFNFIINNGYVQLSISGCDGISANEDLGDYVESSQLIISQNYYPIFP